MIRINRLSHEFLGIQMQPVFTEHARQEVEMHHVLVAEPHDLHNLVRLLAR